MRIQIEERVLHFRQPAGTSRGVYTERRIWLLRVSDGAAVGIGECAPLPDLSCDDIPNYAEVLRRFCDGVEQTGAIDYEAMRDYPSMLFGLETAMLNLQNGERLFDTPFSRGEQGIPINGLVWMGTFDEMQQRIEQKLEQGFRCVKLKIGAIDFARELELLERIRQRFGPREVQLRVDANGAFPYDEALYKLELLSQYALHSIEQPIKAGQWGNMAELCRDAPLRIALDEELIGVNDPGQKRQLLNIIRPAYIILKPSLHGGMMGVREWVDIASDMGIGSWVTSALESNVGLNAVAQLCSVLYGDALTMPQGLGTGQLFTDNIPMPLEIRGDQLWITKRS
ncbi:MAG: o-succinylbenzoate synthase [Prevotella sp.]|nr:o-succinylbenzoate synthase [Prevotella sp.]